MKVIFLFVLIRLIYECNTENIKIKTEISCIEQCHLHISISIYIEKSTDSIATEVELLNVF